MTVKINSLEVENVKRVKAVVIQPNENGLTILGGNNNQGKTSVLDAIAWALGGNKYKPSNPYREGSVNPPNLKITMNNGLVVERKGKNSSLTVLDPEGHKGGQQLLNSFVEELAIDLPKFMESTNKEKADILLQIIGVGPQLAQLDHSETELYNKRRTIGQIKEQKKKYAKEMPFFPEAPKELVSISELVNQQQEILARNGQNQLKRQQLNEITRQAETEQFQIEQLEQQLNELKAKHTQTLANLETAQKSAIALQDESTEELEKNIAEIDEINRRVRINLDKEKAEEDTSDYQKQYDTLTSDIELIRQKKLNLLTSAELPLPGLSVEEGELIYNGQKWDNMSGSDQLKVSTAIVRKLKPQCGFVLLDKLEQMDMNTLNEFSQWLQQEGLQAIATRVSTGDECSIIIEDGYVAENNLVRQGSDMVGTPKINKWEGAAF